MPVSYQTGTFDQKWTEKLCVQNYAIGAVLTKMYTNAEHLRSDKRRLATVHLAVSHLCIKFMIDI
jgi:hypothetical protein